MHYKVDKMTTVW